MITLRRNLVSDILGLTNETIATFKVNNKAEWKKLEYDVAGVMCNRLIDVAITSTGYEAMPSPSVGKIRRMFKERTEHVTQEGKEKKFIVKE